MSDPGLVAAGIESLRNGRMADAEAAFGQAADRSPGDADLHCLLAQARFHLGRLAEAESSIERALEIGPDRPDHRLLLGNILHRRGDLSRAEVEYRRALLMAPDYSEARLNLGNLLAERGLVDAALDAYGEAVARRPDWLPALLSRAAVLKGAGRLAECRAELERMRVSFPDSIEVLYGYARVLQDSGDTEGARLAYELILSREPGHPDAANAWGALIAAAEPQRALDAFERAVASDPSHRSALGNAARLLNRLGRPERAVAMYRRLLALEPDASGVRLDLARLLTDVGRHGEAHRELSVLKAAHPELAAVWLAIADNYMIVGRFEKALVANSKALELEPANFAARVNRALLMGECGDPAAGLALLQDILSRHPTDPLVLNGIGVQLCELGRFEEGIVAFRQALEKRPDYGNAHSNLSFACLTIGDFENGWKHQGHKWKMRELRRYHREVDAPLWRGEPLDGKSLFVWAEQGLGDQVMFAGMYPDLVRMGGQCAFEFNGRLAALMSRSFPDAQIVPRRPGKKVPGRFDFQIPMSGLGEFLRNRVEDFPAHAGYLRTDPGRRAHWRARLDGLGPGIRVGISWRGGTDRSDRGQRSIPLERWSRILRVRGARFVSLQYDDVQDDLSLLRREGLELTHWREAIEDLDEHAALISALDLVISVTTTAIHVAGALGRETWVLVPQPPGWRYLTRGETLPWYPSVRLIRQRDAGDWEPVLDRVAADLAARTAAGQ